jgi:hypothetical protein
MSKLTAEKIDAMSKAELHRAAKAHCSCRING